MKLYGIPASQASRCLWVLEEIGLDYELVLTRPGMDTRAAEFARLNPNRKIPVLVDGEVVLSESMAINFYLAERYGGDLLPEGTAARARVLQWCFWLAHDLEPHLWRFWQEADAGSGAVLKEGLELLDRELASRDWLVGEAFTLADLNLESYVVRARHGGYDLEHHPALIRWIQGCEDRPARGRVREMILEYQPDAAPPPG
jgi:glutathione S-transferase